MSEQLPTRHRTGLFRLIADLPGLVSELIRNEIRLALAEVGTKAKAAGLGGGLVAGGAVIGLFGFGALIATAILALSEALPPWLSALIVTLVLLVIAGILALIGITKLKAGMPPVPQKAIDGVQRDIRTIKGTDR